MLCGGFVLLRSVLSAMLGRRVLPVATLCGPQRRLISEAPVVVTLRSKIQTLADMKAPDLIALRRKHGAVVIDDVTVEKCIGGMRGITGMLSDTSLLETFYVGELSASVAHSQSIGDVTLHTCSKTSPPSTPRSHAWRWFSLRRQMTCRVHGRHSCVLCSSLPLESWWGS